LGLHAPNHRGQRGDGTGPDLGSETRMAEPVGPLRGRSGWGEDPGLLTAAPGSDFSTASVGGGLSPARSPVPGVSEAVRDVVALVTARAITCSGCCGTCPLSALAPFDAQGVFGVVLRR